MLGFASLQQGVAQTWTGTDLTTAASASGDGNKVFIYNVKSGKWLNRGGLWGTEAVLSETGMWFAVNGSNGSYKFNSNTTAENGGTPYLTFYSDNGKNTCYVDQAGSNFTAETTTYNGKTCYRLKTSSTYLRNEKASGSETPSEDKANAVNGFSSADSDNKDLWMFVTVTERETFLKNLTAKDIETAPVSFQVYDNDFARRSTDISHWKNANDSVLTNSNNVTQSVPSSSSTTTYFVGAGVVDQNNGATCGKTTANIHGANGKIYQTISNLPKGGWYEIRCNAFCTSEGKATLYAQVAEAKSAKTLKTEYADKPVEKPATTPTTYVTAEALVNSTATASGTQYYPYQTVVRVYVGEKDNAVESLSFGIEVKGGDASTWTCMDNYELYYIGETGQQVVLDENQTAINYMNTQKNANTTSTVYLHRSLTAGVWNSIVLPFNMTRSDIVDVFGAGTYVCEFAGATDAENKDVIYFNATPTIEANKLYIIKPTISEPEPKDESGNAIKATNTVEGVTTELTKYYTIHKTMFQGVGDTNADYTEKVSGTEANAYNGDDESLVQFVGTYVKKADVAAGEYAVARLHRDYRAEGRCILLFHLVCLFY